MKNLNSVVRIESYLYCPTADKMFEAVSFPVKRGDTINGRLRKEINLLIKYRQLVSGVLRREHGALSHKLQYRLRLVFDNGQKRFLRELMK